MSHETANALDATRAERRKFAAEFALAKHKAGQLGLWRTMQALDAATNAVGWEISDLEQGKQADSAAGC